MADHPNAALVRRGLEAMASGDLVSLDDLIADDVEWHEIGSSEPIRGKAALKERWSGRDASDWKFDGEFHDVVANDEHTVALISARATIGERSLDYRVAEIYHIRDGQITERWAFSDDTAKIAEFFG